MKTVAILAMLTSGLGLAAPAATASPLRLVEGPSLNVSATLVNCGCDHDNNVTAGFLSGFVDSPQSDYYGGFTGYSGFYADDFPDGAAPPYAYFPDRQRVYRMWHWRRGGNRD